METENDKLGAGKEIEGGTDAVWSDVIPKQRKRSRLWLYILFFLILENLVIPPRYQISNNIALGFVWVYQHTASEAFAKSGLVQCRYYPTCSEYGRLALLHDGFLVGFVKGIYRVLRCNPFNTGPHEDWPYEGAWNDCRQLPQPYLDLQDDVHLPSWAYEDA